MATATAQPTSLATSTNPNKGRTIQFIVGIQGVSAGGQMTVNMPTNSRVHRGSFLCTAIAYGLVAGALVIGLEASDTGTGTFSATVVAGVITGVTIVTTNSSKGAGTYPLTITDPYGVGATGTYTVNGSNVITAAAITLGGVTGPVPPDLFFNSFQQSVNGIIMRDIGPGDILAIAYAQRHITGYTPRAGELCFYFTEPWRNVNARNDTTSWDLIGQSTWQIKAGITAGVSAPAVTGWYEFDFIRNLRKQANAKGVTTMVPFYQPVRQHTYQIPVGSGMTPINWLPFDVPISRMWFNETGPGSIYQLEVWEDGNQILEVTQEQGFQIYGPYGFSIGTPGNNTTIYPNGEEVQQVGALIGGNWNDSITVNSPFKIYDAAFISDPDQRLFKALQISKSFIIKVYSEANTNLNVMIESLPGAYA